MFTAPLSGKMSPRARTLQEIREEKAKVQALKTHIPHKKVELAVRRYLLHNLPAIDWDASENQGIINSEIGIFGRELVRVWLKENVYPPGESVESLIGVVACETEDELIQIYIDFDSAAQGTEW